MVAAYAAMTRHMPDNGLQVVMFTHQDAGVWADLGSILWAAGLRVTAAWNVVTETEKRDSEKAITSKARSASCSAKAPRRRQRTAHGDRGRDRGCGGGSDRSPQCARRLLARTHAGRDALYRRRSHARSLCRRVASRHRLIRRIDRQPLDRDLYRKLAKGETTMLRDLVDYAAQVANSLLVPEGFPREMWRDLGAAERFYVRMLDMEAKGTAKVADFQNFAKSFAFGDYAALMASTTANAAALAGAADLKGRMLSARASGAPSSGRCCSRSGRRWRMISLIPSAASRSSRPNMPPITGQRRQKLIGLASYVAAQDEAHPPRGKRCRA